MTHAEPLILILWSRTDINVDYASLSCNSIFLPLSPEVLTVSSICSLSSMMHKGNEPPDIRLVRRHRAGTWGLHDRACKGKLLTFVLAIDHIFLLALDAPGVHQLGLAARHQNDRALLLQGAHKGATADLPQPTPAAQVPHQLQPHQHPSATSVIMSWTALVLPYSLSMLYTLLLSFNIV